MMNMGCGINQNSPQLLLQHVLVIEDLSQLGLEGCALILHLLQTTQASDLWPRSVEMLTYTQIR